MLILKFTPLVASAHEGSRSGEPERIGLKPGRMPEIAQAGTEGRNGVNDE
jgi:hypothetical protein